MGIMKRTGTTSQAEVSQSKKRRVDSSSSKDLEKEVFKHMSNNELSLIEAFESENSIIDDLEKANKELKDKLSSFEIVIKEKEGKIEELQKDKDEFMNITFTEIEKFDEDHRNQIKKFEDEQEKLNGIILQKEREIKEISRQKIENVEEGKNSEEMKL